MSGNSVAPQRDELREVLAVALHAGQLLLEYGAGTARVEETVSRIGTALGASGMDVWVTPTGMMVSAISSGDEHTRIVRITHIGVDLGRVAAVVDVSRRASAGELDRAGASAALAAIATRRPVYGAVGDVSAAALSCACFAVLFGGGAWEFAVVLLTVGLVAPIHRRLLRAGLGNLLTAAITAGMLTLVVMALTGAAANLLAAPQRLTWLPATPLAPQIAIAAAVLLLTPGTVMVTAVTDLFMGDTLSGAARALAAVMVLSMIAVGIWAALLVSGVRLDIITRAPINLPLALMMAFVSSLGAAMLSDIPPRLALAAALVGMLAYGARSAALTLGLPAEAAVFLAGLAIGALAEIFARLLRAPTLVFSTPGFVPLVPGVLGVGTVLAFVNADYSSGVASLTRTLLVLGALAFGIGTVGAVVRAKNSQ